VRLALIYYSIAEKIVYKFVKNDKTRIHIECSKKEDTCCAWRLYASRMTYNTRFAIKIYNLDRTFGGDMGTDWHMRASRKCVAFIIQNILKHRPTYTACDARKDFKAIYGVALNYDKVWWEKELAQHEIYGLARYTYDSLCWYVIFVHLL